MASRTPVAATAAGAAPGLVARGGGRLVPVGDARLLAEAAEEILRLSNSAWMQLSAQAYEIASSYTWDDATDRFEAALFAAVNGTWDGLSEPATSSAFKADCHST
jgi:glycosyltransferase involved in cell wall biosynthesis